MAANETIEGLLADGHDRSGWANNTSLFASRVAFVFATRIAQYALAFLTLVALSRALGSGAAGDYGLVQTWAGMLFAVGHFGLPAAMTYMAGRGRSLVSLERVGLVLAVTVSIVIALAALAILPFIQGSVLRALGGSEGTNRDLLRVVLLVIPCQFFTQLSSGILYTRGHNRVFNLIQVAQAASMLILTLAMIGIVRTGVEGAVWAYVMSNIAGAAAAAYQVHRLVRRPEGAVGDRISFGAFIGYGIRLYPQNAASFFSYRADVFLLSWLLGNASLIGCYYIAVRIAEMTFYVPDSINAMLYPAISASSKADADRFAPAVARLTTLGTGLIAAAIVPVGCLGVWFVLPPDFRPAIPALIVIMPGIVSLSLAKVLSSYVSGLGRPRPAAIAALVGLTVNLVANVILIPQWGIVGASASSLISYTCHASLLLIVSSRWAGVSPLAFVLPGKAEVRRVWGISASLVRQFRGAVAARRSQAS
jgi:O-antigen/teichoic acid export membrane protein